MKKKIVAFTLAISTIFMCCAFTATGIGFEEEIPEAVEVVEESFRVEKIEVFEDKNLENYTQEQLQTLIGIMRIIILKNIILSINYILENMELGKKITIT